MDKGRLRMLGRVVTIGLLALVQPALGQTVLETDFTIAVPDGSGGEVVESTTLAPLLTDTCFAWHIKLGKIKGAVDITEIYTLPEAPETWGLGDDSSTTISDDRKVATTTYSLTPQDGWITEDWCVGDGDPAGAYSFEIKAGEKLLHRFDFDVQEM